MGQLLYGFAMLDDEEGFQDHVAELRDVMTDRPFGPAPDTLIDLLTDVALGSPAICALRALHRIAPELDWDDHQLLIAASQITWGFQPVGAAAIDRQCVTFVIRDRAELLVLSLNLSFCSRRSCPKLSIAVPISSPRACSARRTAPCCEPWVLAITISPSPSLASPTDIRR